MAIVLTGSVFYDQVDAMTDLRFLESTSMMEFMALFFDEMYNRHRLLVRNGHAWIILYSMCRIKPSIYQLTFQ